MLAAVRGTGGSTPRSTAWPTPWCTAGYGWAPRTPLGVHLQVGQTEDSSLDRIYCFFLAFKQFPVLPSSSK